MPSEQETGPDRVTVIEITDVLDLHSFRPNETAGVVVGDEDAVERLTAAATKHIEEQIRRCPEAWLWIHDRWRTRPPPAGEATTE